jgi:hypothetical protein
VSYLFPVSIIHVSKSCLSWCVLTVAPYILPFIPLSLRPSIPPSLRKPAPPSFRQPATPSLRQPTPPSFRPSFLRPSVPQSRRLFSSHICSKFVLNFFNFLYIFIIGLECVCRSNQARYQSPPISLLQYYLFRFLSFVSISTKNNISPS